MVDWIFTLLDVAKDGATEQTLGECKPIILETYKELVRDGFLEELSHVPYRDIMNNGHKIPYVFCITRKGLDYLTYLNDLKTNL